MLIGFIGCPCSGKTTTAALTFADLKSMGVAAEFIPEQARMYIAEKRLILGQAPGSPVILTDEDQLQILTRQMDAEHVLLRSSGPGTVVVTDTAALCTLLYMSPEVQEAQREAMSAHLEKYDLLFYSAPVKLPYSLDANRVHDQEQALKINQEIPKLLRSYGLEPTFLVGDSKARHNEVTKTILERIVG
jgi:thymidylate kinase